MEFIRKFFNESPFPSFIIEPKLEKKECVDFKYIECNDAFTKLLGINREELLGKYFSLVFPYKEEKWLEMFGDTVLKHDVFYKTDLSLLINKKLHVISYPIENNLCACVIIELSDLSLDKLDQLEEKAYMDFLTGTYNRHYLNKMIIEEESLTNFGVAFFDINNLKIINDNFGHNEGDKYIQGFVNVLRRNLPNAIIFRLGGDEFLTIEKDVIKDKFLDDIDILKKEIKKQNMAAIGYKFYANGNIQAAIEECDKLMYVDKNRIKK